MTCPDEKALQRERFREEWFRRTRELRINNSIENSIKSKYPAERDYHHPPRDDRRYGGPYDRDYHRGNEPK